MAEQIVEPVQNVAEEWRVIKDYPNYEVSSLGRLRRNGSKISTGVKSIDGYLNIRLTKDKITKTFRLHRVVAVAFIPNPNNKPQVNHLGAKDDSRVCMLEWVTAQENSLHGAKKNRLNKNNQVISVAKIDKETNEIIKIYKSIIDIENDGYNYAFVRKCINGKNHTHLGYKWKKHNTGNNVDDNNDSNYNNTNLEDEIWKSLKDSIYEEINKFTNYEVSNYGRVKGFKRTLLKPNKTSGIATIQLKENKNIKSVKVYRLVLMGFNIAKPDVSMNEVDHINSINTDNRLVNLQWANRKIQFDNPNTKRKKIMKIKYVKDGVETIYAFGISALSKELKISQQVIYKYIVLKKEYNGYLFEMLDEEQETINTRKRNKLLNVDKTNIKTRKAHKIKVIYNNNETIYDTIKEACLKTNVHYEKIKKYILSGEILNGYKFEVFDTESAYKTKHDMIKKTYEIKLIYNNEEQIYKCIQKLSKEKHIAFNTVLKYAKSGKEYKGYRFEILNDK